MVNLVNGLHVTSAPTWCRDGDEPRACPRFRVKISVVAGDVQRLAGLPGASDASTRRSLPWQCYRRWKDKLDQVINIIVKHSDRGRQMDLFKFPVRPASTKSCVPFFQVGVVEAGSKDPCKVGVAKERDTLPKTVVSTAGSSRTRLASRRRPGRIPSFRPAHRVDDVEGGCRVTTGSPHSPRVI